MRKNLQLFFESLVNSYSQVFFSDSRVFAFILMAVSFADLYAGLAGFIAVVLTNLTGFLIGFDKRTVAKGLYGFNSLLVGLGLGIYFDPGAVVYLVIALASIFTLFISVSLQGIIGKYGLPYLSIPFIIGAWIVTLATREFASLGISERGIFMFNEMYTIGGQKMVNLYEWWNSIEMIRSLRIYFISLGAILFQYNALAGILIAAGLLYHSRIGFTLSLIGFFTAYFFYEFTGASISELSYSYIGFNYILTSIALGGFFVIPSVRSYLWVILLVPIVAMLTISLSSIFSVFYLPVYALPFNIVVILFLYVLKFRINPSKDLAEVIIQQNSPEKNLYSYTNDILRFRHGLTPVKLPFFGTWEVMQSHDGEYTHKGEWKHALDFVMTDHEGIQYRGEGNELSDYYCYNKPVTAVADGFIESVVDNISDNDIGSANIRENWGNNVIIKHKDFLYSSVNHLVPGSVPVKEGEKVKQGDIIGRCGNSGRSHYPHLHFQLQATPYIGSRTLNYPVSYYIQHGVNGGFSLHNFSTPLKGERISNIEVNPLITSAFELIPGRNLSFRVDYNGRESIESWEVNTDEYNNSFIRCEKTGSMAYFVNDGNLMMFRHYKGSRTELLYWFYLSAFKLQQGFYKDMVVCDEYPLNLYVRKALLVWQDFVAPFFRFIRSEYTLNYKSIDSHVSPSLVELESLATNYFAGRITRKTKIVMAINKKGICSLDVRSGNLNIRAECTD
ncbi:MAG: peptidase M23 [Bacteroidia bacterium]|nr:MAG: peptidase M23 [Bacteroidia bacterium]